MTDDPRHDAAARRVFLYSGHMVDAPDRAAPRFPPGLESRVAEAIARTLDALKSGASDIAVGSGACGSDLLFAEALLARGSSLRLYLPFAPATFIEHSVAFAGRGWIDRFEAVARRADLHVATDVLGPLPNDDDPYERTNLWMLDEARRLAGNVAEPAPAMPAIDARRAEVEFLSVWNGEAGDGPGGARHLMDAVRSTGGTVHWIDPTKL